ncbi:hypothetical protein AYK24_00440 [Thermoplasmatales archaeon SG8-52-4]|nr:MAG: hypothetical protein AYK24_00440 [Thermoplasmatales archaeon SG8-52-4]
MFEVNNDLNNIKYKSWHNWFHFCASLILTIGFYFIMPEKNVVHAALAVWMLGILWEMWDGINPWYYEFEYDESKPYWLNWLRENFCYSDKFSLQDAFVWNLSGCLIGMLILKLTIG